MKRESWSIRRSTKQAIKRSTPHAIKAVLTRWANSTAMELALRRIQEDGYVPDGILDIGAYRGEWTRLAKSIWPNAHVWMFEAQDEKAEVLERVAAELEH